VGEFLDKLSILRIKQRKLLSVKQNANIARELGEFALLSEKLLGVSEINSLFEQLLTVNMEIWDGMEQIFTIGDKPDVRYEGLSRHVTSLNKKRSLIKKKIDLASGSELTEEKSYFEI
jgi:hypothetical protein